MARNAPRNESIHYEDLELDKENPRLPKSFRSDARKEERDIINFMLLQASTLELMLAIGENGYFPGEQLLVVKKENGKCVVIEGNRRLTAVKLLHNPELATVKKDAVKRASKEAQEKPEKIPCLVFDNENEILKYLGFRHITGVKSWRLLEKARYMHTLWKDITNEISFTEKTRVLAKMIGSRKDYVQRIIVGFEIYKVIEDSQFYEIPNLNDTNFDFNYIADGLRWSNITKSFQVDWELNNPVENLDYQFIEWWTRTFFTRNSQNKKRLLGNSEGQKNLNILLDPKNSKALEAFNNGKPVERALELTGKSDEQLEEAVKKALSYLEQADAIAIQVKNFYIEIEDDLLLIRRLTSKIKNVKEEQEDEQF